MSNDITISAPDVTYEIYNALCDRLIFVEAKIKRESTDDEVSLFKDPERKKLIQVDESMKPLPLIFTEEEQTKLIQAIYPVVEQGLYSCVYFHTCQDRWIANIGLDIYEMELEGYKNDIVSHVITALRKAIIDLDIFNVRGYDGAVPSVFYTDNVLFKPVMKPFEEALEKCDIGVKILSIAQDPSENDEK